MGHRDANNCCFNKHVSEFDSRRKLAVCPYELVSCPLSTKIEARTGAYSTQRRTTRRRRNPTIVYKMSRRDESIMGRSPIFALSLFLLTMIAMRMVENIVPQPSIFVRSDSMVDVEPTDDIDTINTAKELIDHDGNGEDDTVESDADFPTEDPLSLPASLLKATRVGAKIREVQNTQDEGDESLHDNASPESEMKSPNVNNAEEAPIKPKPPLNGCHWGATGCNKGKRGSGGAGEVNSSSVEADDDNRDGMNPPPSSSSLAGSASAKIEARVMKGRGGETLGKRGPATSPPVWDREGTDLNSKETHHGTGHNTPPHGFKLAGRIVTSPSDGLSYYLDPPKVNPEDHDGDWMMTIPYGRCHSDAFVVMNTLPF